MFPLPTLPAQHRARLTPPASPPAKASLGSTANTNSRGQTGRWQMGRDVAWTPLKNQDIFQRNTDGLLLPPLRCPSSPSLDGRWDYIHLGYILHSFSCILILTPLPFPSSILVRENPNSSKIQLPS